jgi:hypothetical protein
LTSYQREQVEAIAREEAAATPTTQHDGAAQAEISEEKAARRAAMTAKIAEKYAAAKAASEAAVALANAQAAAAPVNRKMFARGAAVLYDNPKNGKLELAHVTELHRDPEGEIEYYTIETNNGDERQLIPDDGLILPDTGTLRLGARLDGKNLQFAWAAGANELQAVGPLVDASILSDENACGGWGFTGAFIGLCAIALDGSRHPADFDWFSYREADVTT